MNEQDYEATAQVSASIDMVYDALTTIDGLSAWWTQASGDAGPGGVITFHFGPDSKAVMKVEAAERGTGVRWLTTECMLEDWVGTSQHWELRALPDGGTEIHFRHAGLTPKLPCYGQCKSGWDHYVPSLATYVETGTGNPNGSPADLERREARSRAAAAGAA
jgi:uncharacterized protein YndB with AHSA1/START domain